MDYADSINHKYPLNTEEEIREAWHFIHLMRISSVCPMSEVDVCNKEEPSVYSRKELDEYNKEELEALEERVIHAWREKIDPIGPPGSY